MKKILAIFVFVFVFFLITRNVFAATSCAPRVLIDTNQNVLVVFSTTGSNGTPMHIALDNGLSADSNVQGGSITFNFGALPTGKYIFSLSSGSTYICYPSRGVPPSFDVGSAIQIPTPSPTPTPAPSPVCKEVNGTRVCETAVGNIQTNPGDFIKKIFSILLSLAGGVAILLIIISGYRYMASQGNPEKVQEAREHLTSAIVGLLFIIFSLAILQIIGFNILRIPGFAP